MNRVSPSEIDPAAILTKTVAVIGYGNQGHAHALNLRDQGVRVLVGAREGRGHELAVEHGFDPLPIVDAVKSADVVMLALPDEAMADVFDQCVRSNVTSGAAILVCHGLTFHFGLIEEPDGVDVALVAPKGSGASMRREYVAGRSLAALVAVHQDSTGQARQIALSYAWGIGCARSLVLETTFKEECVTDLFGEQAVLCGGIPSLIKAAFRVLVERGYSPEAAYLECLHEAKLITDLIYERGLTGMREAISDTAEWGGYQAGTDLVDETLQSKMERLLDRIESGEFTRAWIEEARSGKSQLAQYRNEEASLTIEETGAKLRPDLVL